MKIDFCDIIRKQGCFFNSCMIESINNIIFFIKICHANKINLMLTQYIYKIMIIFIIYYLWLNQVNIYEDITSLYKIHLHLKLKINSSRRNYYEYIHR